MYLFDENTENEQNKSKNQANLICACARSLFFVLKMQNTTVNLSKKKRRRRKKTSPIALKCKQKLSLARFLVSSVHAFATTYLCVFFLSHLNGKKWEKKNWTINCKVPLCLWFGSLFFVSSKMKWNKFKNADLYKCMNEWPDCGECVWYTYRVLFGSSSNSM